MSEHSDLEDCSTSNLGDLSISCSDPCAATDTGATKPPSILSVIRAPKSSDLARTRKIASNPPTGKKKSKALVASEPSNVDVRDHLKQFPNEPFAVGKSDKLFCKACREIIFKEEHYSSPY